LFRNGLLKNFSEVNKRKVSSDGKTGKKSGHLLDDRQETRRCWKFKEKALGGATRKYRCGRFHGRVARQTN
jgi:hypothetical protein